MSDDGLCVIDYDVAGAGQVDRSSLSGLQLAARTVLNNCVANENRGGVVTDLGQHSHLVVTMKENVPRVHCTPSDDPPVAMMCENLLDAMPASKGLKLFGNCGIAGTDVEVPWTMATADFACVVNVQMTAGMRDRRKVRASWYQVWEQAVALTRLCSHAGREGQATVYGPREEPSISITIDNGAGENLAFGASNDLSQQRTR